MVTPATTDTAAGGGVLDSPEDDEERRKSNRRIESAEAANALPWLVRANAVLVAEGMARVRWQSCAVDAVEQAATAVQQRSGRPRRVVLELVVLYLQMLEARQLGHGERYLAGDRVVGEDQSFEIWQVAEGLVELAW